MLITFLVHIYNMLAIFIAYIKLQRLFEWTEEEKKRKAVPSAATAYSWWLKNQYHKFRHLEIPVIIIFVIISNQYWYMVFKAF